MTIPDFLAKCAADIYPEPRTDGHDYITGKMVSALAPRLPVGASILDVGCGQGPALEAFTKAGFHPTGITLNQSEREELVAARYNVLLFDQNAMPKLWEGYFDCVWARHVLEHSPIPFFTLHEFVRVLKPGGWLYAEMPLPETSCHHETNPNHYSVLTESMWASLITRAGFVIKDSREITIQTGAGPDCYINFVCTKPNLITS